MRGHTDKEIYEEAKQYLPDPWTNEGLAKYIRVWMNDAEGWQRIYTAKFICVQSSPTFGSHFAWEEDGITEYGVGA